MPELNNIRREYIRGSLDAGRVRENPLDMFSEWMDEAVLAGEPEPTAMTLATATADGKPSARIVLLKDIDDSGFVFFTNYLSRKGKELESNPFAALVFLWNELERQVRVEGKVTRVSTGQSDQYFITRPKGSRISAIVSPQSSVIEGKEELEKRREEFLAGHANADVRPAHWGGYKLDPVIIEFWQGRADRFHDRLRYSLQDAKWIKEWLAP